MPGLRTFHAPRRDARRTSPVARRLLLALAGLLVAGCGSDSPGNEGTGGAGSEFQCSQATDTYSVGLSKMGSKGLFEVMLMDADPAPPAKKDNTWQVHVKDVAGNAVTGATLSVNPTMPEHGHGSTQVTVVTDLGNGAYELEPVYLQMAGYWAVSITVTMGAESDTAQFDFCIAP